MRSPSAFAATAQVPTADVRSPPARGLIVRQIWPTAIIVLGLGLTAAWAGLLAYGLVKLIGLTI